MSRKSIWFLASFAAVALTALILVQLVWIKDGIAVQEKQFDQLINQAMNDIVSRLEEHETAKYLKEELNREQELQQETLVNPKEPGRTSKSTTLGLGTEENEEFLSFDADPDYAFRDYELLSGDTMVLLTGRSLYDLNRSPSHSRTVISQADLVQNYEQLYANRRVFVERVFNRMVRYEGPIENRLSKVMLDSIVHQVIGGLGVNLPYEFAVKTARGNHSLRSHGFDISSEEKTYTALLYPQDIITTPNFLVIYFKGQRNFIFKSVSLMAVLSLILIFLLLIVSFIAIYVIVRQKKLSEIKNDFVSNMTHELKTPISTISLASQMLADDSIPPENKNTSHISHLLKEESKRLGLQVEKVLQMSIFEQGKMRLKIKSLDPEYLLTRVVDSFGLQFQQRQADIELDLDFNDHEIMGDETHLSNVFSNLIDNALKYSLDHPDIRISGHSVKKGITIKLADEGMGMSR